MSGILQAQLRNTLSLLLFHTALPGRRLGITAPPAAMASSGWGWQNSRPPTKTPAEWSARFRAARSALQNGRLLPPAALLPAAALLHECSLLQLLPALPQTLEALVLSGRSPQTAAEFESEQLKSLDAARKRVLAVLYPGLATVLRAIVAPPPLVAASAAAVATTAAAAAVGQHSNSVTAVNTSAVTSQQQCSDVHVRRLAAKVNIMAACTLRGLVEGAVAALHTYFSLYAANTRAVAATADQARFAAATAAAATAASTAAAASAAQSYRKGSRLRPQQRLQQQRAASPFRSSTAVAQKQYRNSFMPGDGNAAGDLPPAFVAVLVLESSNTSSSSSSSSSNVKLGCSASCAAHAAAVQRVVRAVFACFKRVPRVSYSSAYSAAPDADLLLLPSTSSTTATATGTANSSVTTAVDEDLGAGVWGLLGLTPTTVSSTAAPTVVPTVTDPNVDGTSPPSLEELMADVVSDVASGSDVTKGSKNSYLPVAQPSEAKMAAQLCEIAQLLQENATIAAASTAAFGPFEYLLREQRTAVTTAAVTIAAGATAAAAASAATAQLAANAVLDSADKDMSHVALDALSQVIIVCTLHN
jgi:trimeric autotransporter adhesin